MGASFECVNHLGLFGHLFGALVAAFGDHDGRGLQVQDGVSNLGQDGVQDGVPNLGCGVRVGDRGMPQGESSRARVRM